VTRLCLETPRACVRAVACMPAYPACHGFRIQDSSWQDVCCMTSCRSYPVVLVGVHAVGCVPACTPTNINILSAVLSGLRSDVSGDVGVMTSPAPNPDLSPPKPCVQPDLQMHGLGGLPNPPSRTLTPYPHLEGGLAVLTGLLPNLLFPETSLSGISKSEVRKHHFLDLPKWWFGRALSGISKSAQTSLSGTSKSEPPDSTFQASPKSAISGNSRFGQK
jgi:hypothetical protein